MAARCCEVALGREEEVTGGGVAPDWAGEGPILVALLCPASPRLSGCRTAELPGVGPGPLPPWDTPPPLGCPGGVSCCVRPPPILLGLLWNLL